MIPARLLSSTLLAAVAAVALCFQTALLLDWLFIPHWYYLFIFCSTAGYYSVRQLFNDPKKIKPEATLGSYKSLSLFIAVVILLVGIFLVFKLSRLQLTSALIVILLSVALVRVKHSIGRKLLQVLVWTTGTTVITASFIPYGFDHRFWCLLCFRFFYLLAIFNGFPFGATSESRNPAQPGRSYHPAVTNSTRWIYSALFLSAASLPPAFLSGIKSINVFALLASLILTFWLIFNREKQNSFIKEYARPEVLVMLQTLLIWIPVLIP